MGSEVVFSNHLLLSALLYKAEDNLDRVRSLLDNGGVQHIVPLATNCFQQKFSRLASSPKKVQGFNII